MRALRCFWARLQGRWAGRIVVLIALVLALPSIFSPLFIDEHLQTSKWNAWHGHTERSRGKHILNDYFVFADQAENQREMEHGLGLWWTAPDFKIAFWRPLAAATHVVDHYLWPGNTVLIHLHGLLWFLALLVALNALYRRFLAPPVATLALALYAWDDARGMVLSWIANRHALIAGVFGIGVLIAHDRWRREGWRPGAWLAPALLALGLLSSEMALATTAFLLGHALFIDRGSLARRIAYLFPYGLVVAAWQWVYLAGGYGVVGSGGYVNPLAEPLLFAAKVIERAPIYMLAQLTPFESMLWGMYSPGAKIAVYLLALAVVVVVARVAWPRLAASAQSRFWLVGVALSLVFICASGTWDRQLVFVGFGAAPVLAMVIVHVLDAPPSSRWPRFVVCTLAVFNLVLAPLVLPLKSMSILGMVRMLPSPDGSVSRDATVANKTLVVPWINLEMPLWLAWSQRDAEGIPKPRKTRVLSVSFGDVFVARPDAVTLVLRPKDGFFAGDSSKVFRSSSRPFHKGDVVKVSDMTATVVDVLDDGRPLEVEFRFATPLESPEWLWMRGVPQGLAGWTPPKVGQAIVLPAVP
jgi:hypothetical protein